MKISCSRCNARKEVDTSPPCKSWTCPICKQVNKITVDQWEPSGGWLDENGICHFPSMVSESPNGVFIGDGALGILDLVVGIKVKKPEGGFEIIKWNKSQPLPLKVLNGIPIGLELDKETIDELQKDFGGKAILIGESDSDIQDNGLTPEQWISKYKSNGMGRWAKMQLDKLIKKQKA
jgi:hypothetical protein